MNVYMLIKTIAPAVLFVGAGAGAHDFVSFLSLTTFIRFYATSFRALPPSSEKIGL